MFKSSSKNQSFTEGPLFVKIILFAIPIMLTSILQTLYNVADNIIVGRFSGDVLALAAVGSTSALTALIINLLINVSAGTGVVVAQAFGAKDYDLLSRATHTSVSFAGISGVGFMIFCFAIAKPALILMGTQPELLEKAVLYVRIISLGIPASAIYNFAAATLRSVGDSKTPLIILSSSGIINVILNLFFVITCHMAVAGVAIATVISQYASAVWIIIILIKRRDESYAINIKKLAISKPTLLRILRFGIPAALQGAMFSISNMFIATATNVFTNIEISAKTITSNIDGIVYSALSSYSHAPMTVTAQNFGANKPRRIRRAFGYTLLQVTVLGFVLGYTLLFFAKPISSLFVDASDPNRDLIIEKAYSLISMLLATYFVFGIQDTCSGMLRGLGYSMSPMIMSIIGTCFVRVGWVIAFYNIPAIHSFVALYAVYPISWITSAIAFAIFAFVVMLKLSKKIRESEKLPDPETEKITV